MCLLNYDVLHLKLYIQTLQGYTCVNAHHDLKFVLSQIRNPLRIQNIIGF